MVMISFSRNNRDRERVEAQSPRWVIGYPRPNQRYAMASEEKTKSRRSGQRTAPQSQPRQNMPAAKVKELALESPWHERAAFQIAFDHSIDAAFVTLTT